jgi:hypothetical protein
MLLAVVVFLIFAVSVLTAVLGCLKIIGCPVPSRDVVELARGALLISLAASLAVVALLATVQP